MMSATNGACPSFASAPVDIDGNVTIGINVARGISNRFSGPIDCIDPGTECVITVYGSDELEEVRIPITFDPNAPIPPPPTATASPDRDLDWRQPVAVTGSGYVPNSAVVIQQCATVADGPFGPLVQCAGAYVPQPIDANGNLDTTFTARRWITNGSSDPFDCSAAFGLCYLQIEFLTGLGSAPAPVPLGFDPTSVQPPGPPVTVTPHDGLTEGDVVQVAGSGFSPNATIGLAQCTPGPLSISDCDITRSVIGPADAQGAFAMSFTVSEVIQTQNGEVRCADAPGTCVLGVANIADYIESTLVPLGFAVPELEVHGVELREGTRPTTAADVEVELSAPNDVPVTVRWTTVAGSATSGSDFVAAEGDLVIPAGRRTGTISTDVIGDPFDELTERYEVRITSAIGAKVIDDSATVTIKDDDREPNAGIADAWVTEGDGLVEVPVIIAEKSGRIVTVEYRTHHDSARSGSDFERAKGTVTFAPGSSWRSSASRSSMIVRVSARSRSRSRSTTPSTRAIVRDTGRVIITDDDRVTGSSAAR